MITQNTPWKDIEKITPCENLCNSAEICLRFHWIVFHIAHLARRNSLRTESRFSSPYGLNSISYRVIILYFRQDGAANDKGWSMEKHRGNELMYILCIVCDSRLKCLLHCTVPMYELSGIWWYPNCVVCSLFLCSLSYLWAKLLGWNFESSCYEIWQKPMVKNSIIASSKIGKAM